MIYQQRIPTVEAHQIFTAGQALSHVPGGRIATPGIGEDWRIEWDVERGDETITVWVWGREGDFMIISEGGIRVIPKEEFLSQWEIPPITLRAPDLRSSDLRG